MLAGRGDPARLPPEPSSPVAPQALAEDARFREAGRGFSSLGLRRRGLPAGRGGRAVTGEAAPSATATGNPRARLPPLCKDPPKVASVTLAQEHV